MSRHASGQLLLKCLARFTPRRLAPATCSPVVEQLRAFAADTRVVVSFPLAQTGEGISECELVQWFVEEGQHVDEFGKVCEVQSDKASIEITSRYTGRIVKLHHQQGDIVKVGAALIDIELANASQGDTSSPSEASVASTGVEGSIVACTGLEGSNSTAPEAAPHLSTQEAAAAADWTAPPIAPGAKQGVLATPAVRALARELGVALEAVELGQGRGARVLKQDILRAAGKAPEAAQQHPSGRAPEEPPPGASSPSTSDWEGPDASLLHMGAALEEAQQGPTRMPIRGYRRAMVKAMTEAASKPHFHFMDEVDMGQATRVRSLLRHHRAATGLRLTLLPLMLKALSVALLQHPGLNASLAPGGTEVLLHPTHNIGVAMATPSGLVVPNIKQVERKSVLQIARELEELQQAAQAGRLSPQQLTGGTITVSNIGSIGGTYATPLVNGAEVAIVALGRVRQGVRLDAAGRVEGVPVMNVSWGADHRVVDGAALAEFCGTWKALLEEPAGLLLHLS